MELRRMLSERPPPRKRMTEAPIKLPRGRKIPNLTNEQIGRLFDQEDITHLHDVYRRR